MLSDLPLNTIICGDCREVMKTFPDDCIDLVVTSPPYWGLRDYGSKTVRVWGGEIECEHEWRSQVSSFNKQGGEGKQSTNSGTLRGEEQKSDFCSECDAWRGSLGLEPHPQMFIDHLTEICNEVKRILTQSGSFWLNLGDTYYGGPPEHQPKDAKGLKRRAYSQKICERCGKQYIGDHKRRFCSAACGGSLNRKRIGWLQPKQLLGMPWRVAIALQEQGWILRNCVIWHKPNHMPSSVKDRLTPSYEFLFFFVKARKYFFDLDSIRQPYAHVQLTSKLIVNEDRKELHGPTYRRHQVSIKGGQSLGVDLKGKNPGDLWTIPTKPFPGAHFAVFPPKLIEPIIKAGCPINGVVLDPFAGSGTVLRSARKLGRKFIGVELNPEYIEMAEQRIRADKYSIPSDNVPKITDFRVVTNSGADNMTNSGKEEGQ